jgi:putative membrane protein
MLHLRLKSAIWFLTLMAAVSFGVAGCDDDDHHRKDAGEDARTDTGTDAGMDGAVPKDAAVDAAPDAVAEVLNDNQIAAVAMAANTGEIEEGQFAEPRATNTAVRDFAMRMVTEHTASNMQLATVVQQQDLMPAPSATSQQLMTESANTIAMLQGLSGTAFDQAYIASQVTGHQQVLTLIDTTLIPQAQNAELRAFLETMRATVAAHLAAAEQIQATIGTPDAG